MKVSKMFGLAMVSALFAANAFAGFVSIGVGTGERALPSCGGTVEVNNGGNDNQLNVVFRNVQDCSNLSIPEKNKTYKLQEQVRGRGGSYTVTTAEKKRTGFHSAELTLESNSGAHSDEIEVFYEVINPSTPSLPPSSGGNGGW